MHVSGMPNFLSSGLKAHATPIARACFGAGSSCAWFVWVMSLLPLLVTAGPGFPNPSGSLHAHRAFRRASQRCPDSSDSPLASPGWGGSSRHPSMWGVPTPVVALFNASPD